MEQIAEPGKAYLTEHTARLVEGQFALHDLGKLNVKGVKEPVRVYELQGLGRLRTRLEVSRARGFSNVGRQSDMAALEMALERAIAGNAQVVGIVGEPGVRKRRSNAMGGGLPTPPIGESTSTSRAQDPSESV
jgi:hypothetical protein